MLAELERWLRIAGHRLASLWRRGADDAELDEELLEHVERLAEQYRARGMPDAEALRRARAAMGGVTRRREEMRDARGFRLVTDLIQDLRYAARSLRRTPSFTAVAVTTLGCGIAAAALVFSLVDAALFRPPPFSGADRLMVINFTQHPATGGAWQTRWSWSRLRLLMEEAQSFDAIASSSNVVVTLTGAEEPEPLAVEIVSSRYFDVLGATLIRGRGFGPSDDDGATAAPLVVLGYRYWQDRFGGRDDVIGRTVQLNGIGVEVAGVAAPDFAGLSGEARAWLPVGMAPRVSYADYLVTNQNFITAIGRLRAGVGPAAAVAELAILGERIHAQVPSEVDRPDDRFGATAIALNQARIDRDTERALLLLGAAAGVLLLIACANVASLLLGRAAMRRREIGVRLAIGAGRGRLVRQLLGESGVLALAAGAVGVGLAAVAMPVLRIPATMARGSNFYGAIGEFATPVLDWRVLLFGVLASAATVVLTGLLPALRATRSDLVADLALTPRGGIAGRRIGLREAMVALQLAMSIILLVGCGLLLASYARVRETPVGFDPGRILTFMIRPSEVQYPPAAAPALIDRVLEEIARVPGVESASVDGCAPLASQCASALLRIVGRDAAGTAPGVFRHYVGPDHFRTLGVPVEEGRSLLPTDRAGTAPVVVINRAAATRFWPGGSPIGQRVWFDGAASYGTPDASAEIVGVVADVAYRPVDQGPPPPSFFTPYSQFTYASRMVLVRTAGDPLGVLPAVGRAVRRADPSLALFDVRTMDDRARVAWSKRGFQAQALAAIAGVALLLAITGVYAVTTYFVASRRREIGMQIALGASRHQVARASLAVTVRLGLAGVAIGLIGAATVAQLMRAVLYQTPALDPLVFGAVVLVLLVALIAATIGPVRRALRVDPMEVLRCD